MYGNGNWSSNIYIKYFDKDIGVDVERIFGIRPYLYIEDKYGKFNSFFDTKLIQKDFSNVIERTRWIKEHSGKKIYGSYTPERQFLLDNYYEDAKDLTEFTSSPLKIYTFDIEIQIQDEFPEASKAKYPINVMTIYDNIDEHYYIWVAQKGYKHENTENRTYFVFNEDYELLPHFLEWFSNNRPDIITGWNTKKFDLPYLINRCYIMEDEATVNDALSPIGEVRKVYEEIRGAQGSTTYTIAGIPNLDYLILYKHKFGPPSAQSYKLDAICQSELGLGKLEYDGTIKEFMESDFDKFVEYNIVDVERVVQLDEKLKFITLARYLCNMGLIEYDAIFKSIPLIVGVLSVECLYYNKIMLTQSGQEFENGGYEGAFVKDPIRGLYTEGVYSLDLNSLYPNIMMAINISPEKKIGKILNETDTEITLKLGNKIKTISIEKYKEKILPKITISGNGVLFERPNTPEDYGIIPKFLEKFYTERKSEKSAMIKYKIEAEKTKDTKLKTELLNKAQVKDTAQHAFKIILNSIYGAQGSKYFPLFDLDLASAVTSTGREIITFSSDYIDKNNLGTSVYCDTDSVASDTLIRTNSGIIKIEDLYNTYNCRDKTITDKGHEIVYPKELKVMNFVKNNVILDDVYQLIRHKVTKKKWKIRAGGKEIIMTNDHSCMVKRGGKLIEIKPFEINKQTDKFIKIV